MKKDATFFNRTGRGGLRNRPKSRIKGSVYMAISIVWMRIGFRVRITQAAN